MSEDEFWRDDAEAIAQREQYRAAGHGGRRFSRLSLAELEQELPGNAPRFTDPNPETNYRITLFFAVAIVVVGIWGIGWIRNKWEPKSTVVEHFPALSAEDAKAFSDVTKECIRRGLLLKIVGNDKRAVAYVLTPFHQTTVDMKSDLVKCWYGATFGLPKNADERFRTLTIKDGLSGKTLRQCDMVVYGVEWD